MAFTKNTDDMNIIQKLDDEPNDVGGLTATQLKVEFDKSGIYLKAFINSHIDELGGTSAAGNIGFATSAAVPAANVQAAIENVQSQLTGISQGGVANGSITAVKLADGAVSWEDVSEDVDVDVDDSNFGTIVESCALQAKKFLYSRAIGIMAYEIRLGMETSAAAEIRLIQTNYLAPEAPIAGRAANVFMPYQLPSASSAIRPQLAYAMCRKEPNVSRMEYVLALTEARNGQVFLSGWYFCDGE